MLIVTCCVDVCLGARGGCMRRRWALACINATTCGYYGDAWHCVVAASCATWQIACADGVVMCMCMLNVVLWFRVWSEYCACGILRCVLLNVSAFVALSVDARVGVQCVLYVLMRVRIMFASWVTI